jgi:uncharacterized membrane-anchored protein YhcB (DUF1043 family)
MALTYGFVFLLVGVGVGFLIARFTHPQFKQQKDLQKELEKSQYELEQYRQELVDHFASSAGMLDTLSKDFAKLYQHMATTSSELMPNLPQQDNPFSEQIEDMSKTSSDETESTDEQNQPKDYAKGATGLLKDEIKTTYKEKPQSATAS